MPNPILIVHGWNDTSDSFNRLREQLTESLNTNITDIPLADWLSREDDISYDDLADAFEKAWQDKGLPRAKNSVDVVIHSTGALVVRHWLVKYCTDPQNPPIGKFIMLAPANFGSPLADMGRTIIGRARNGFKKGSFETGAKLLKGLEIASPYSWWLAEQDRFGPHAAMYEQGPNGGGIQCSVFVGNEGNMTFIAEFPGSDGTVRTSTANMNCRRLKAFFKARPQTLADTKLPFDVEHSTGETAYRLYEGLNHGQASQSDHAYKDASAGIRQKMDLFLQDVVSAFQVDGMSAFEQWIADSKTHTKSVADAGNRGTDNERHGYQNTVVRVIDSHGKAPDDYALEIYDEFDFRKDGGLKQGRMPTTRLIQKHAIDDVHNYGSDLNYRCFHINCKKFRDKVFKKVKDDLRISITAEPLLEDKGIGKFAGNKSNYDSGNKVGYYSSDDADIGYISIPNHRILDELFVDHTTFLLDLGIERCQRDDAVRFD